jgi:hypothetical protein
LGCSVAAPVERGHGDHDRTAARPERPVRMLGRACARVGGAGSARWV